MFRFSFGAAVAFLLAGLIIFTSISLMPQRPDAVPAAWTFLELRPSFFTNGEANSLGELITPLIGHMFLHAGWLHLGMNMLVYFQIGPTLATRMDQNGGGAWRFFLVFFGSGLASAAGFIMLNPMSDQPAVGASGAISGLFSAYLLAMGANRPENALRNPRVLLNGLLFLGINVGLAAGARSIGIPIAWEAHLAGFIGGAVIYPLVAPRYRPNPWLAPHQ